ncbi:hypothetical protein PN497_22580, partial [Sphaerospermopsis kisseleviana CS-549]
VRITICTKKYFDQEKPLIYLVSALTVAWVNKQRQDTECIPPKFDGLRKPKKNIKVSAIATLIRK